jgi:hypothetical protein
MSKDSSSSGKLLGTIKFVFDKTKSRTLNATQAYDVSTSQIVLASYPAKATKKAPAKSLEDPALVPFAVEGMGTVWASVTYGPSVVVDGDVLGKDTTERQATMQRADTATVGYTEDLRAGLTQKQKVQPGILSPNGVTFTGLGAGITAGSVLNPKSNANKEIYYGAITVAIGEYRTWQGKYAVLKVDLLTDKAVLRVYDE